MRARSEQMRQVSFGRDEASAPPPTRSLHPRPLSRKGRKGRGGNGLVRLHFAASAPSPGPTAAVADLSCKDLRGGTSSSVSLHGNGTLHVSHTWSRFWWLGGLAGRGEQVRLTRQNLRQRRCQTVNGAPAA